MYKSPGHVYVALVTCTSADAAAEHSRALGKLALLHPWTHNDQAHKAMHLSVACGLYCSDKQAIDCLRQAGWSVEGGIDVFYASGMQVQMLQRWRSIASRVCSRRQSQFAIQALAQWQLAAASVSLPPQPLRRAPVAVCTLQPQSPHAFII